MTPATGMRTGRRRRALAVVGTVVGTLVGGLLVQLGPAAAPARAADQPTPGAARLAVAVPLSRTVTPNVAVTVSGSVSAPAGGLIGGLTSAVGSLVDALLRPDAPVPGLTVSLQLQTASGWTTLASGRTTSAGAYALRVPTYFLGTHAWRVTTAATRTSTATSSSPFTIGVRPDYTAVGSARSFRLLDDAGARWNPCAPVPFRVNRAGMPRGAMAVIGAALAQVRAASGITFVYAGSSRAIPFGKHAAGNGLPATGFTIAWSTPKRVAELRGSTVAISGSTARVTQRGPADFKQQYITGGLVIDRTERLATRMGRGKTLGYVLMHEMGHVLGLAHTPDQRQVMAPYLRSTSVTRYGAGDLAGLAAVGLAQGCV